MVWKLYVGVAHHLCAYKTARQEHYVQNVCGVRQVYVRFLYVSNGEQRESCKNMCAKSTCIFARSQLAHQEQHTYTNSVRQVYVRVLYVQFVRSPAQTVPSQIRTNTCAPTISNSSQNCAPTYRRCTSNNVRHVRTQYHRQCVICVGVVSNTYVQ